MPALLNPLKYQPDVPIQIPPLSCSTITLFLLLFSAEHDNDDDKSITIVIPNNDGDALVPASSGGTFPVRNVCGVNKDAMRRGNIITVLVLACCHQCIPIILFH